MIQQNHYTINIHPGDQHLEVELDSDTIIQELYEELKVQFKIQEDINQWTCFSVQRQKYLQINEKIGNFKNEILNIQTQPQQLQQPQEIKNINLKIVIKDGAIERILDTTFKTSDTIDDIAKIVSQYCSIAVDDKIIAIDIFIFGSPYNDAIKRKKALYLLQIKENTTIDAKIRWIGG